MNYQIMEKRLTAILQRDKCNDPQNMCEILKGELSPIIQNYIDLNSSINVRFKQLGEKLVFNVEIDASRIKPFGYLPKA